PAAIAGSSLARTSGDARTSAASHRIARLWPARSAQRVQVGGVQPVRDHGGKPARGRDLAADAGRNRAEPAAAGSNRASLHASPSHRSLYRSRRTGDGGRTAGTGDGREWNKPCGATQSERFNELGQGRAQRTLPVRIRQKIQALSRQIRLSLGG